MKLILKAFLLLLPCALIAAGLGVADARAFDSRAQALESRWNLYTSSGVPARAFAGQRAELQRLESERVGPIPYRYVSRALIDDPLISLEGSTDFVWQSELAGARQNAESALAQLRTQGLSQGDLAQDSQQLTQASSPGDLNRLADQWQSQARQLQAAREAELAAEAAAAAKKRAEEKAAHDKLIAAEQDATYLLNQVSSLLSQYRSFNKPSQTQAQQLQSLQQSLQAATSLDQVTAVEAGANQLITQLNGLIAQASVVPTSQPAGGCLQNVPAKLIVVHLVTQRLIAYDQGCVFLSTPVTTGRPALPTGQGTFQIFYKSTQYLMRSPWPQGSPYWYPNTWVGYAMEFEGDGTFIHTADWEPSWAYGPGSEYGGYASHGCVHVMDGPAASLYSWAPIGTTVIVEP